MCVEAMLVPVNHGMLNPCQTLLSGTFGWSQVMLGYQPVQWDCAPGFAVLSRFSENRQRRVTQVVKVQYWLVCDKSVDLWLPGLPAGVIRMGTSQERSISGQSRRGQEQAEQHWPGHQESQAGDERARWAPSQQLTAFFRFT